MKFLHAADVHLDSPLRGLLRYDGAPVDEIRAATRRALENLVELAVEQEVDFVLIAGDVYDGDWKDHNTGLFYVSQMSRLREADIPVVMISGNHDAANKMTRSLRMPNNVELLSHTRPQTAKTKKLRELGVAVHGRSFARPAEYDNLVAEYPETQKGLFNIGLLHTSLAGAEGHEAYAPCTIEDLRRKQYDYWALGHVHNREVKCSDPPIVFSGNIQGRHVREPGAKGCYLVTVDSRGSVELEFQPLDVFRWAVCELAATEEHRAEDVCDTFGVEVSKLVERHAGLPLAVRVVVTGRSPAHDQFAADPTGWTNQFRAAGLDAAPGRVWVEKILFHTSPLCGRSEVLPDDGPIGELLRYLDELRGNDPLLCEIAGELAEFRRKLPDELTHGDDALTLDDPGTLRGILDDIQPLLLSRLKEEMRR